MTQVELSSGEAVCRPISGSLIAEVFTPSARGLANGIFSWGVYYGYGLAYVVGIYLTKVPFAKKVLVVFSFYYLAEQDARRTHFQISHNWVSLAVDTIQ